MFPPCLRDGDWTRGENKGPSVSRNYPAEATAELKAGTFVQQQTAITKDTLLNRGA